MSQTASNRAAGKAIPSFSGTVAHVGENGFGLRSLFGNGGSGAVCDRAFVANKHRSEKPVQGGPDACLIRIVGLGRSQI